MSSNSEQRPVWLGIRDLTVLAAYISLVSFTVHFHQAWEDEGIAWMIARLSQIYPLLFRILRYQGHPCLWYLLLWIPAHLHMPYVYINWVSAMIASLGIYVLLRFSPFPFYLRALLPFGFFLGYEYAVVARSYVLFPILGFLAADLYRRNDRSLILMATVLALLANVSIHGTIVAVGFALLCCRNLLRERRVAGLTPKRKHQAVVAAGIFAGSVVFVAICIWPPHDIKTEFTPEILKPLQYHGHSGPLSVRSVGFVGQPSVLASSTTSPSPNHVAEARPIKRLFDRVFYVIGYSLATSRAFAVCYYAMLLFYLYKGGKLWLMTPAVLLAVFFLLVLVRAWHLGLIWVTLLMVLWTAWDTSLKPNALRLQNVVAAVLAVLCVLQIPWTWGAVRYEIGHSTYPAKAAATYLKTLSPGKRMDQLGLGFTVLPYFSENIFIDHGGRPFSGQESMDDSARTMRAIEEKPDVILVDSGEMAINKTALRAAGYRETHSFCGAPYFPNLPLDKTCLLVLEKSATQ